MISYYDSGVKEVEGNVYDGFFKGDVSYYDTQGKLKEIVNNDNNRIRLGVKNKLLDEMESTIHKLRLE